MSLMGMSMSMSSMRLSTLSMSPEQLKICTHFNLWFYQKSLGAVKWAKLIKLKTIGCQNEFLFQLECKDKEIGQNSGFKLKTEFLLTAAAAQISQNSLRLHLNKPPFHITTPKPSFLFCIATKMKYKTGPLLPLLLSLCVLLCATSHSWAATTRMDQFLPATDLPDNSGSQGETSASNFAKSQKRKRRDILMMDAAEPRQVGWCEVPPRWCANDCNQIACTCRNGCYKCPYVCTRY